MKKTSNKGFSLVELIIVIAIMAILAGAIAPALIRYIDKARKSDDVSSAKTIKTAVETAMSNEDTYAYLTTGSNQTAVTPVGESTAITPTATIKVTPATATTTTGGSSNAVVITATSPSVDGNAATILSDAQKEIAENIGEKTPKIKYKKGYDKKGGKTAVPTQFTVYVTSGGTVSSGVTSTDGFCELAPNVCKYYQ